MRKSCRDSPRSGRAGIDSDRSNPHVVEHIKRLGGNLAASRPTATVIAGPFYRRAKASTLATVLTCLASGGKWNGKIGKCGAGGIDDSTGSEPKRKGHDPSDRPLNARRRRGGRFADVQLRIPRLGMTFSGLNRRGSRGGGTRRPITTRRACMLTSSHFKRRRY